MSLRWCVIIYALLLCSTLQVNAGKYRGGGSHSYPKSGGLSGGSRPSHSYPSNTGLSGNNHRSPAHSYPSAGQSHVNPTSSGKNYPASTGSHGYPGSPGLSGNSPSRGAAGNTHTSHTTYVQNNYHYSPPQQIRYTPVHGGAPVSYPVYHGTPPTYVYQYKDSGSKYGTLLAGLALLNLGTLAGTAYVATHNGHGGSSGSYRSAPGEICKFGVKKENGDYEETKIDCQLISSFIMQEQMKPQQNGGTNTTSIVTTTVTNVTMVNGSIGVEQPAAPATSNQQPIYTMLANGTLVPLNGTLVNGTTFLPGGVQMNMTSPAAAGNGVPVSSSSVTTTTTNTTIVNALDVKGKPVDVTPGMVCYVLRHTPSSNMKKSVPCGLLQSYATQSLKKNSATRNMPLLSVVTVVAAMILTY